MPRFILSGTIALCLFLSSCLITQGDNIARSFTSQKSDTTVISIKGKNVLLYFQGELISFKYERIGMIEVQGNQTASTPDLLNHLKYEALKHGANGVVGINDKYMFRQTGLLFSKNTSTYTSHVFTGLAVKIKEDDLLSLAANKSDTSFYRKVYDYDVAYNNKSKNEAKGSLVLGVLLVLGVIIYLATKK